jgi:hypothetical protein
LSHSVKRDLIAGRKVCFQRIVNNRLIDGSTIEECRECIKTIVDYWKNEEKKECFKKALEDDKHCDDLIKLVRKQHNLS